MGAARLAESGIWSNRSDTPYGYYSCGYLLYIAFLDCYIFMYEEMLDTRQSTMYNGMIPSYSSRSPGCANPLRMSCGPSGCSLS